MRGEDVCKHCNYLGNSYKARPYLIFPTAAGEGPHLVSKPAAPGQCMEHHRVGFSFVLSPRGPCGWFLVGWEWSSPAPTHPKTLHGWPPSAGVGITEHCFHYTGPLTALQGASPSGCSDPALPQPYSQRPLKTTGAPVITSG